MATQCDRPARSNHSSRALSFTEKLRSILADESYQDVIHWTADGNRILIPDASKFTERVLSNVFTAKDFSSFTRQLNNYNFRKTNRVRHNNKGMLDAQSHEFEHEDFKRDTPFVINPSRRKIRQATAASVEADATPAEAAGVTPAFLHAYVKNDPAVKALERKVEWLTMQVDMMKRTAERTAYWLGYLSESHHHLKGGVTQSASQLARLSDFLVLRERLCPAATPMLPAPVPKPGCSDRDSRGSHNIHFRESQVQTRQPCIKVEDYDGTYDHAKRDGSLASSASTPYQQLQDEPDQPSQPA